MSEWDEDPADLLRLSRESTRGGVTARPEGLIEGSGRVGELMRGEPVMGSGGWRGAELMLGAVAQIGQAVSQTFGPMPDDVAKALRALMEGIRRHG